MSNKDNLKIGEKFKYVDSVGNICVGTVKGKTPKGYKTENNGNGFVVEYKNVLEENNEEGIGISEYKYETDIINLYNHYIKKNYGVDLPSLNNFEMNEMMNSMSEYKELKELDKNIEFYSKTDNTLLAKWLKELKEYKTNG